LDDHVAELVQEYAKKNQTSASLETLMKTGRGELLGKTYTEDTSYLNKHMRTKRILMQVASFIRKEMPIRLACRIQDLDQVPMMRDMPSVQAVKDIYIQSFLELIEQPKIRTPQDERAFASLLENLSTKHSNILMQMARGAYELRQAVKAGDIQGSTHNGQLEFENMDQCHEFLNRFYMSRIGIRVLAGQYLALRGEPLPTYVGMICSHTSPYELVERVIHDATLMCEREYGEAPYVDIQGSLHLTFPYIPTHLHYIFLELLKNAMRATMEKHAEAGSYPPVTVIIADGTENEDVVVKVADEGGGICRSQVDKIWSYLYTTADPAIQEEFLSDHSADSPIAGLGYGLPISRSYCRYFGGDLDIMSLEGYGTDAYVYLKRLGNAREPLFV
jgi:pyruvate dehydrogenase kinase 2/3/4